MELTNIYYNSIWTGGPIQLRRKWGALAYPIPNYYNKVKQFGSIWDAGVQIMNTNSISNMIITITSFETHSLVHMLTKDKDKIYRIVYSTDFMTANAARIPFELIELISSEIINRVRNVSRVVLDISNKPPATIEWE